MSMAMSPSRRAIRALATVACMALFLVQTGSNVALWLREPLSSTFAVDDRFPSPMASVTVCPNPPFDVEALLDLGLNDSTASAEELLRRVENLEGVDASPGKAWHMAAWPLGAVVRYVQVEGRRFDYSPGQISAPGWRRSLTPLGPCHTFYHGEPTSNLELSIHRYPLKPYDFGAADSEYVLSCDHVESVANTSCDWEKFVRHTNKRSRYLNTNLILHSPDDPPTLATPTSVLPLSHDNTPEDMEVWMTARRVERLGGEKASCQSAANYSQEECQQRCAEPCHPRSLAKRPPHPAWNVTNRRSPCPEPGVTFQNLTESQYRCLDRCKPRCSGLFFQFSPTYNKARQKNFFFISLRQSTPFQTTVRETKVRDMVQKY